MVTVTYSKRTTYPYKQNEFNFKDEVEMESNRTCAEVCFVKNPKNFFVRLDEHRNAYLSLVHDLQNEYFQADNNK
jgi:hypothetical protein